MKCEAAIDCKQPAEVKLTWLVHGEGLDEPETREGGCFCGSCAAMLWAEITKVPSCASSAICEPV